ncbi:hypothetical protein JW964_29205 [candidate division KSB1 bacterium]|nr:hypothetical protein [candidate division KSB1 bacterium]
MSFKVEKKFHVLFFLTWLMTRLLWSLEISRLIILRFLPAARIQYVIRRQEKYKTIQWFYEKPFFYGLTVDTEKEQIIIKKLNIISKN